MFSICKILSKRWYTCYYYCSMKITHLSKVKLIYKFLSAKNLYAYRDVLFKHHIGCDQHQKIQTNSFSPQPILFWLQAELFVLDKPDLKTDRVGPSGSKIGLSWVGLALRVKIRVKFGSGWSGLFDCTSSNQLFLPTELVCKGLIIEINQLQFHHRMKRSRQETFHKFLLFMPI